MVVTSSKYLPLFLPGQIVRNYVLLDFLYLFTYNLASSLPTRPTPQRDNPIHNKDISIVEQIQREYTQKSAKLSMFNH